MKFNVIDIKRVTFFGVTRDLNEDEWKAFKEVCQGFIDYDQEEQEPEPIVVQPVLNPDDPVKIMLSNDVPEVVYLLPAVMRIKPGNGVVETPFGKAITDYTLTAVDSEGKETEVIKPVEKPKEEKPKQKTFDRTKYVKLHEAGASKAEILEAVVADGYHITTGYNNWPRILESSSRVTIIEENKGLTDEEKINKLFKQNKAEADKRKKIKLPKV